MINVFKRLGIELSVYYKVNRFTHDLFSFWAFIGVRKLLVTHVGAAKHLLENGGGGG